MKKTRKLSEPTINAKTEMKRYKTENARMHQRRWSIRWLVHINKTDDLRETGQRKQRGQLWSLAGNGMCQAGAMARQLSKILGLFTREIIWKMPTVIMKSGFGVFRFSVWKGEKKRKRSFNRRGGGEVKIGFRGLKKTNQKDKIGFAAQWFVKTYGLPLLIVTMLLEAKQAIKHAQISHSLFSVDRILFYVLLLCV